MATVEIGINQTFGQMYVECANPKFEVRISTSQRHSFCTLAQIPYKANVYYGEVGDRVLSVARNFKQ